MYVKQKFLNNTTMKLKIKSGVFFTLIVLLIFSCGGKTAPANAMSAEQSGGYCLPDSSKKMIVVDVRTPGEWADGHAACAVNYPLDEFASHIAELKQYQKVVLVCRSGGRAGSALSLLESAGYENAENAGAWENITCAN
jgi:rhodanese-related sulfurtransferase